MNAGNKKLAKEKSADATRSSSVDAVHNAAETDVKTGDLLHAVKENISGAAEKMRNLADESRDAARGALESLKGAAREAGGVMGETARQIGKAVEDTARQAAGSVSEKAREIFGRKP